MARGKARRGRKPSIGTAAGKLQEIHRTLKSLVTEISRLEQHLVALDGFYVKAPATATAPASSGSRTRRRRGPNVRDLAYQILSRVKRGLPVTELSRRVAKLKGGRVGAQFAQNLGTALRSDRRFRRVERGVYAVRQERRSSSAPAQDRHNSGCDCSDRGRS